MSSTEAKLTIFVRNLPHDTHPDEIERVFRTCGKVKRIDLPRDSHDSKLCRGYAFVNFQLEEDARYAVDRMDGIKFGGRILQVEHSKGGRSGNRQSPYERKRRSRSRSPDREKRSYRRSPMRTRTPERTEVKEVAPLVEGSKGTSLTWGQLKDEKASSSPERSSPKRDSPEEE